jgi:hypothetical protein
MVINYNLCEKVNSANSPFTTQTRVPVSIVTQRRSVKILVLQTVLCSASHVVIVKYTTDLYDGKYR